MQIDRFPLGGGSGWRNKKIKVLEKGKDGNEERKVHKSNGFL